MNRLKEISHFGTRHYLLFTILLIISWLVCLGIGSVSIPINETIEIIKKAIVDQGAVEGANASILLSVRLPRILTTSLVGASLALSGAAMQGLLRNPLAEGGTLGVTSGAALGAVVAIAFGIDIPWIPFAGTVVMSILFAFLSIIIIMTLAYKLDFNLSTNTIILLGVIYGMFVSSIRSFIIVFASKKLQSITSWSMGSLSGSTYGGALTIAIVLLIFGSNIYLKATELDAFAISEENASHIGVDVKRVKLSIMLSVSAIIGVAVAFSGSIGFVGLIIPHMMRKLVGPNHRKLLIITVYGGAIFLVFADLIARVALSPIELPIGVITSFIGSILFVYIYYSLRTVK